MPGDTGNHAPLDLGLWITVVRVCHGLTRRELADRAHLSYAELTNVEAGVALASPRLVAACAAALGVDEATLTRPDPITGFDGAALLTAQARAVRDALALPAADRVRPSPTAELSGRLNQVRDDLRSRRHLRARQLLPPIMVELRATTLVGTVDEQTEARRLLVRADAYLTLAVAGPGPIGPPPRRAVPGYFGDGPAGWLIALACLGLGGLLGFGLAELYYSGNLVPQILGGVLGVTAWAVSRLLMSRYGPDDPGRGLGRFGYLGVQTAIVMYVLAIAIGSWHSVLWIVAIGAWVAAKVMERCSACETGAPCATGGATWRSP